MRGIQDRNLRLNLLYQSYYMIFSSIPGIECGNQNLFLVQVLIYKEEDVSKWNALKFENDVDALKRLTLKDR